MGAVMKTAIMITAIAAVGLSGCATIFEGTSQEITVVTNPPDASCVFERQGTVIATIPHTPAAATVRKLKYDITIKCDKPGYQQAQYLNHSGTSAAIAGNIAADLILTAGLSSIVDSANGADNKYDSAANITLTPIISQSVASVVSSGPKDTITPTTEASSAAGKPAAATSVESSPKAADAPKTADAATLAGASKSAEKSADTIKPAIADK